MNDAWLAGLVEGEGFIGIVRRGKSKNRVAIKVNMTDEDVVQNAREVAGVGVVYGPYEHKKDCKPQWIWQVLRREDITNVLTRILPYMGERRTERINECLELLSKQTGDTPVGVHKIGNRYRASYRTKHLGMFSTPEEAKEAYETARKEGNDTCILPSTRTR